MRPTAGGSRFSHASPYCCHRRCRDGVPAVFRGSERSGRDRAYISVGAARRHALSAATGVVGGDTITTIAGGGTDPIGNGVPANSASLGNILGLAVDAQRNVYIADASAELHKVDAAGTITILAGTGVQGYTGDGGPATAAQIFDPFGVAVDGHGNVYFADRDESVVRKVNAAGIISTVAGSGAFGATGTGNGGPATSAPLCQPVGVTVDGNGNLYFVDCSTRVPKVDAGGIISTIATGGNPLVLGDGGRADAASVAFPAGVAVDGQGNLLITEVNHSRIRKVWKVPLPTRPATGGSGVESLRRGAHGHGFRVRVQLLVPGDCIKGCTGLSQLRVRSGHATYPTVPLPGDGTVVLGTQHSIGLGGHAHHKIPFYLTVSKAKLLHTKFSTRGHFRVANTRLRIWFTKPGGEVLLVRDGQLRVSIAKIRSGALPGLKHIL